MVQVRVDLARPRLGPAAHRRLADLPIPELATRHRAGFAVLNLALVLTVVGGLVASASMVSAQRDLVTTVFTGGGDPWPSRAATTSC